VNTNAMDLKNTKNHDTIDIERRHIIPLKVDGRFIGELDLLTGDIKLYYRGKQAWYSLAEERKKAGL